MFGTNEDGIPIGFKSGSKIEVQCELVEVEWEEDRIKYVKLRGEKPKIVFMYTEGIEYVLVDEIRNLRRSRRQEIKGVAADVLQSAT